MTAKQRAHYFTVLWPAACHAQDWSPRDAAIRRDVTLEATGKGSTGELTQLEITRLFDFLKLLADPLSLAKAIPVANPDVAEEAHLVRRKLHVIDGLGFADAYVARCAKGFCAADGKSAWRELSSASLEKLAWTLKARARQRDAATGDLPPVAPRKAPYHQRETTRAKRAAERAPHVAPRIEIEEGACPF